MAFQCPRKDPRRGETNQKDFQLPEKMVNPVGDLRHNGIMKFGDHNTSQHHNIKDGEIKLVSVVNPCFYWVKCSDCPSLKDIHDLLDSYKPVRDKNVLRPGDKVVIKKLDPWMDPSWQRAVVLGFSEVDKMCNVNVYLPDDMTCWWVNRSSIYTIENSKWEELSTAHIIGLYGGVPAPNVGNDLKDDVAQYVTNFLKSHKDNFLEFSFDEKCEIESPSSARIFDDILVFGRVTLKTTKRTDDLLVNLIREKWAFYQENYSEVLECDGWLKTLEKEVLDAKRKINPNFGKTIHLKKVHTVIPPPSDHVDRDRLAALWQIHHTRIEDQILPIVRTETHEEYNERMRRSAEFNGTNTSVTPNLGSKVPSPTPQPSTLNSHTGSPQPPKSIERPNLESKVSSPSPQVSNTPNSHSGSPQPPTRNKGIMKFGHHIIKDGEIRLMLVVNPCCYWVTCSDCPSLQDVHDLLDSYKPVPVKRVPEPGDRVVINRFDPDVQQAMWYRAVVSSYDKLGNMCHVYLPDSMTVWPLRLTVVYTIDNSKWEEISTPHIIGLHGGAPAPTDSDSLKAHALKCTSDILLSHEDNVLEFSFVEKCKSKSSPSARRVDDILVFGNVTLKTPECTKDLLDRLVHTRKVIQPENYFEVLENDGWLTSVEKTIRHVERSLNSKLNETKPEKVPPMPPPSSPKDLERVAVSSRHNQLKGQIPQTTKTETNEKHDPQMGRSTESAKPPIGRGVFMQNVKSATNVKSNLKSQTEERCQMPKPPVACGRGWVFFTPRTTWADRSCSSVTLPGRSSDAADGQFDDAGLSYTASVTSADEVFSRDPAVLKIMTSAFNMRRVEASDEQPSAGRGRILKRPLWPSCQKSPCSKPDAPPDFGSRTFSSKPIGSELGGKLSTPGTERALPDHETLPAAEPSILVQRSPSQFSDSDQSPVLQFGTKDQPHHLNPICGSKQNFVFETGKKSQQNPNSVSIMGDKSEPKTSIVASAGKSERPASVHDEQNGISNNGINKPVGGACYGTKPDQGNLLGFLSDSGVVVSSKSLEDTKGLIFGEGSSDLKVAGYLGDLNLHPVISKSARSASLTNLTRVQSLAMPAILERRDVLLIGPNRTKTFLPSYLVPLMSLLMDPDYYSALPPGNGPRCIIVAPTSVRVITIGLLCSQFGGQYLRTITTYGGGLEMERAPLLSEGCDILVTTPRCWLRLIKRKTVTNARRMCHLVLDRFDVLQDLFSEELRRILGIVKARCEANVKLPGVQIVASCEKWTPRTEKFVQKALHKPVLVFTSFVECAVLCKIKPTLIIARVDVKIDSLKRLIETHGSSKIAIACNTYDDVIDVREAVFSTSRHSSVVVAHEKMKSPLLNQITDEWRSKKIPVLVFSDRALHDFSVTDADVLIHFSLPPSKSSFGDRFVTVRDAMVRTVVNPKDEARTKVYILIAGIEEPTNQVAFPFIVEYMERFRVKIDPLIIDDVKNLKRRKEVNKKAAFCDNILQTGRCSNGDHCEWRHALRETDQDNLSFTKGLVRLAVCHIHSNVKFSVRILQHNPHPSGKGTWTDCNNKYGIISRVMSAYFGKHSNRRSHGVPQVGDVVAYPTVADDPTTSFHRARVVDIVKRDHREEPSVVRIFVMDFAYEVNNVSVSSLYELPAKLKGYHDQAELLYMADLKPVDLDTSWSNTVQDAVARAAEGMEPEDEVVARLMFRFGNSCIVDSLTWVKRQHKTTTIALDLRKNILSSGCGLGNTEYTETMEQLFRDAHLDYPGLKVFQTPKIEEKKEPPAWAHLPSEPHVYAHVQIHDAISPALFYVTLYDFQNELMSLERDIDAAVSKRATLILNPKVGDVCITKNTIGPADGRLWNRCMIKEVHNETVTVLFVDYGKFSVVPVDQLFEIPWKFVTKLPFQAIECSLAGVKRSCVDEEAEWCEESIEDFLGVIADKDVYVKVLATQKTAQGTGGRKYDVVAVSVDSDNRMSCVNEGLNFGARTIENFEVDFDELKNQYFSDDRATDDQEDAEADDWDEPYVPLQRQEIEQRVPDELFINEDEADLVGAESWIEQFFSPLLPVFNKNKARMIEEGPSDAAPQNDVAQSGKVDETPKPAVKTSPEAGKDGAVAAKCSTKREDGAVASVRSSTQDPGVVGLSAATREPAALVHIEQNIPHKTPKVCWLQDSDTVTLRYMIPCLTSYHLEFSCTSATLIAWVSNDGWDDVYHQKIFFFGQVNGTFEEKEGASYLSVKLRKLVSGHDWPRLTMLDAVDKRVCYVEEDNGTDEHDPGFLVEKYWKHGEAARQRKALEDEDVGVLDGYLVPAPENEVESDDDLVCPVVRAARDSKLEEADDF